MEINVFFQDEKCRDGLVSVFRKAQKAIKCYNKITQATIGTWLAPC